MYESTANVNYPKWIFLALSLLWLGIIYSFSLQPADVSADTSNEFGRMLVKLVVPGFADELDDMSPAQQEQWNHVIRKCAHFTEYLILGVLSTNTLYHMSVHRKLLAGFGLCGIAATIDETIQLFVAGRSGQGTDVLLDCFGAFVGIMFVYLYNYRIMKHCRP